MTITLSTSAAAVATPPADAAEPEAPAADGDHAAPALPAVDALAAFGATHGLHRDVQRFAAPPREALPAGPAGVLHTGPDGPGSGAPVAKPEVAGAIKSPPTKTACKALPQTYDVNATTPDQIADLRACGLDRMADTIEHAKASYADLLALKPPATILVTTSAGNGGQPVMVVMGPEFKKDEDANVHTYYHGDNATVADPLGSKDGHNARIRAVILGEDKQAVFVLPEAGNSRGIDSPAHDNHYGVAWSNVKSQAQTTNDALAEAGVRRIAERTVSAHSGGGMALIYAINNTPNGTGLLADRLDLYDCVYHFGEPDTHAFHLDEHLAQWAKTPNGHVVHDVVFVRGSNQDFEARGKVIDKGFDGRAQFHLINLKTKPPAEDANGKIDETLNPVARDVNAKTFEQTVLVNPPKKGDPKPLAHNYRSAPESLNHYRTSGQYLGAALPP
jgi:hypothetical protein